MKKAGTFICVCFAILAAFTGILSCSWFSYGSRRIKRTAAARSHRRRRLCFLEAVSGISDSETLCGSTAGFTGNFS